jgi:selenocysteine lyase/cysteine desulfurase
MKFNNIRKQTTKAYESIYLETPARGLVPQGVLKMSIKALEAWESFDQKADYSELLNSVKEKAATLLKVDSENLTATTCTSHGLSIIANSFPWEEGNNMIMPENEHPNNFYPWAQLKNQGVEVRLAKTNNGFIDTDELISLIDENTRIIALSLVTFYPGGYFDLERLVEYTKDKDIYIVLDAIQAIGFVPVYPKELGIDAIATAAYKGLMTPYGAGLLYVSDRLNKKLTPKEVTLNNLLEKKQFPTLDYDLIECVDKLQPMPINISGLASMSKSLDIILDIGIEEIESYLTNLSKKLVKGLNDKGVKTALESNDERLRHIVCIEEENAKEVAKYAQEKGLYISPRRSGIRMGLHIYNNLDDVNQAIDILESYYNR